MNETPEMPELVSDAKLAALATERGVDPAALAAFLSQSATVTVATAISAYLAGLDSAGTRRSYSTSLRRFRDGVAAICDQMCEPCLQVKGVEDFRCRCDCTKCVSSRVSLPAQGGLAVSEHTLSLHNAKVVAKAARRNAQKRARVQDRKRIAKGLTALEGHGRGAEESAVAALRSFFAFQEHPLNTTGTGVLTKPTRRSRERRALTEWELIELCNTTELSGNDPDLDSLIVEYGIATGARRLGAYSLTVRQLRFDKQMIEMRDKGEVIADAPVSLDLLERLRSHAIERGGPQCDTTIKGHDPYAPVFWSRARNSNGRYRPLGPRRFDDLHERWRASHQWAEIEHVGYHHIRHTIAERLKTSYGQHVAQRYLRHADTSITDNYGRCTTAQLAGVMGELLGFEHPLVVGGQQRTNRTIQRFGLQTELDDQPGA